MGSCQKKEEPVKEQVSRPVKTITVELLKQGSSLSYPAKVEAMETADLSFEQTGKIIDFQTTRGQEVSEGELIARLDPANFEQNLNAQKAKVSQAEAELERYRKLYEEDVVALADFQVKERDYKFQLAEMKVSEKALEDTYLKAPFAGVISKQFVENFQNVQAKEPIVRLQNITVLELVIDVPEKDIIDKSKDKNYIAQAEFNSIPNQKFDLEIKEWETEADSETQTFRIKLKMNPPEGVTLLPGMTASVSVRAQSVAETENSMFVIPSSAVFADATGASQVWILNPETETATIRKVTLGEITGTEDIQVTQGLSVGEIVIVAGVNRIREDMKVRPLSGRIGKETTK